MSHTPWKCVTHTDPGSILIQDSHGYTTAEVFSDPAEPNANRWKELTDRANLIAAAPDLLAECEKYIAEHDRQHASIRGIGVLDDSDVDEIRAAIKKAKGV